MFDNYSNNMNFSAGYLYDCFNSNYHEGLQAINQGKNAVAKEKLNKAAEYLGKLAFIAQDKMKDNYAQRAKRLKDIADAIPVTNFDNSAPIVNQENSKNNETGMEQFFTFYTAAELTDGFEDLIGLDQAKAAVTEYIILPHKYPQAYNYKFLDSRALLLEGPPGTGKTTFAKAVAKEINQPFALINVATLVNCYVGETGKNIDKVFAYLRQYSEKNNCGITIFIDELDEIAKKRGSDDKTSEAAVPALLRNLDGMKKNKDFLILANTNRKDMLDSAILERFRKQLYIPLPDETMRKRLFESKLREVEAQFLKLLNLDKAGATSEGLSGRDITFICDDLKYFLSEIKAGISSDNNLSDKLLSLIEDRKKNKNIL